MGMDLGHLTLTVKGLAAGGQAEKAGVAEGWRVVSLEGARVTTFDEFSSGLKELKAQKLEKCTILFRLPLAPRVKNSTAVSKNKEDFRGSVFAPNPLIGGDDDDDDDEDEDDEDVMEGFLLKKGSNVVNPWQSRFFTARGHYLRYYKNLAVAADPDFCLCAIDLNLVAVEHDGQGDQGGQGGDQGKASSSKHFKIRMLGEKVGSDDDVHLKASTASEAAQWCTALRRLQELEKERDAALLLGGGGIAEDDEDGEEEEEEEELAAATSAMQLGTQKDVEVTPPPAASDVRYSVLPDDVLDAIEKYNEYRDAFTSFDKNGDGTIDSSELRELVGIIGISASPDQLQRCMGNFDANQDGVLDWVEFCRLLDFLLAMREEEKYLGYRDAFLSFDKNGDGTIDSSELRELVGVIGISASPDQLQRCMGNFDANQDGVLDWEEFCRLLDFLLALLNDMNDDDDPSTSSSSAPPSPPPTAVSSLSSLPTVSMEGAEEWHASMPQRIALQPRKTLSKSLKDKSLLKRQAVPARLKPARGAVNQPMGAEVRRTVQAGQERKVARRRSVTSRRCHALLSSSAFPADGTTQEKGCCPVYHVRDSPYCHQHASLEPSSAPSAAAEEGGGSGTSEMEDALNKAVELELDHVNFLPANAKEVGAQVRASLPVHLASEFEDPLECFQLKKQFQALLAFAGDANGDGLLQSGELLSAAEGVGDSVSEHKVNLDWARTVVAGVSGLKDVEKAPLEAGINFEAFANTVAKMRRSQKCDRVSLARRVTAAAAAESSLEAGGAGEGARASVAAPPGDGDSDSDDDEEEDEEGGGSGEGGGGSGRGGDVWHYPVTVPLNAVVGTVLSVPLPGGQVVYAPVPYEDKQEFAVPMPPEAVQEATRVASAKAAGSTQAEIEADAPTAASAAAASKKLGTTDPLYADAAAVLACQPLVTGQGPSFLERKGREAFCLNSFLCLREAATLKADLPPKLEGWVLKRGDGVGVGFMNAWRVRYFRLEARGELVYYDKKPESASFAEDQVTLKKRGDLHSVAAAEEKAGEEGRSLTDKEKASALVSAQDEEVFHDKSLKGSINLGEVVDIQLSLKTAVTVSAAKQLQAKTSGQATAEAGGAAGSDLAEDLVVFKVTSAKMRRFVLAVPYAQVVPWVVGLARHVHFARASLRFRREFGSGVSQQLTLAERIQWATSTHGAKVALALLLVAYRNKYLREKVLNYTLYSIGPISITPGRIITAFVVTRTARDVYIRQKYLDREKKYGVKWQYKKDVFQCGLCATKFPTVATRKEFQKHHCRMCGRVVCHACASTMLFYPVSGKRQRTCDQCLTQGAPPEHCKASTEDQKSVLDLIYEAKAESDSKKGEEAGGGGGGGRTQKKKTPDEVALAKGKSRKSDLATWADWGIQPSSLKNAKAMAARLKKNQSDKKKKSASASKSTGGGDEPEEPEEHLGFTVFLPDGCGEGDTIEVGLPNGKKLLTYVANVKEVSLGGATVQTMQVEVAFGRDGVFFAVPPKEGYDMGKIAEAREKAVAVKLLEAADTANKLYSSASSAFNAGKDAADLFGVSLPGGN